MYYYSNMRTGFVLTGTVASAAKQAMYVDNDLIVEYCYSNSIILLMKGKRVFP